MKTPGLIALAALRAAVGAKRQRICFGQIFSHVQGDGRWVAIHIYGADR